MSNSKIKRVFHALHKKYEPQGWWPLTDLKNEKSNNKLLRSGYHPFDYSFPKNKKQQYEICIGAILTQNTSWKQAEKSLNYLKKNNILDHNAICEVDIERLKVLIKPSGYFNQKALKIKKFTGYFLDLKGRTPEREELLDLWGIGPETADSMLLYAFKKPVFVVDAYTKRIFSRILGKKLNDYSKIQSIFHNAYRGISDDTKMGFFNEYHSLIVEHGKKICKKEPLCLKCMLEDFCEYVHNQEF